MSDLTVKGRPLPYAHVRPLPADRVITARQSLKTNGTDDVIFQIGDTYHIASGRGLPLRGVKLNDPVTLDGRPGKVVATDRQLNTFTEGLFSRPGLAIGGGLGVASGAALIGIGGVNFLGLGLFLAVSGLIAGLLANAVVGLVAEARPADPTQPR